MEYHHLGRSGIRVSELSYGSWVTFSNQVDVKSAVDFMSAAYEAGVNYYDNAEIYAGGRSEEIMGAALKELGWRRGSYLVSTKFFWGLNKSINERNTLNRKRLIEGINGSLQRLQLEYVDLIFCHRPDPGTPIEETAWAMHNIIERGKAMYWGTSEWAADEIVAALEIAEKHHLHKPITEQPEYNLFKRERFEKEYARLFRDYGYGSTTWSPLASGLLTGKYNHGIPKESRGALKNYDWLKEHLTDEENLAKVRALEPIAKDLNCTMAQLSIAWILKNPNVSTVIMGASRMEQIRENMQAAQVVTRITPDILERIDKVFGNKKEDEEKD
jgi:voltage-dependent potassium channel beta subunit